ncbi:MAG: hypothetical protein U0457_15590 [Candidatus Sericytochromatia bacterium]
MPKDISNKEKLALFLSKIYFLYHKNTKVQVILIFFTSIITTLLVYISLGEKIKFVPMHWDGPNYIEVAKTLYFIPDKHPFKPYKITPSYFATHLPLYPILIRTFSFVGYENSAIFVTIIFAALATVAFYFLLKEYKCVQSPFYSAIISTFIPVRWLLYKSISATEPIFLFLVFISLIAYKRNKITLSMILASLSCITRITGILILAVYFLEFIRAKKYNKLFLLLIIPIPLFLTFSFYYINFGDFFAYFTWNQGNNGIMKLNPLQVYINYSGNGNNHHSELYFLFYVIYALGLGFLVQYPALFLYSLVNFLFFCFIYHDDLSRYTLAFSHFTLIIAYDKILNTIQFKLISLFVLYLSIIYASSMIPHNVIVDPVYKKLSEQPEIKFFSK